MPLTRHDREEKPPAPHVGSTIIRHRVPQVVQAPACQCVVSRSSRGPQTMKQRTSPFSNGRREPTLQL
jgi:hypothetical protein